MTEAELQRTSTRCARGLVMDVMIGGDYRYAPSPLAIGIFEFTMMRTGGRLEHDKWARLFAAYMEEGLLYAGNFGDGQQVSLMRAVPHDGSILPDEYVEVLDYEKAAAIVDAADRCAIGMCSCRHEHRHLGDNGCRVPARDVLHVRRRVRGLHGTQRPGPRGVEDGDARERRAVT
jgi:hypothetical protein